MGHVLQCHHLAMPGLWRAEWVWQPVSFQGVVGLQNKNGFFQILGFSGLFDFNIAASGCRPEKGK
jgi:hypothetical protein